MPLFADRPELLRPFREGRRDALEQVYRVYVRSVDAYVRVLARASGAVTSGDPTVVGDVVQEVFVRAFSDSARRSYDGLREYRPYLMMIARNCFVDVLRARRREVLKRPEDLPDEACVPPSVPSGIDPAILAILNDYLAALPEAQKGIYEQRFVLGRSQEAASSALGLSRRGLRTGEARLRTGLRRAIQLAGLSLKEIDQPRKDFSTKWGTEPVTVRNKP
jgi:RNA polymerase sigma factor (sigma-70 family)